MADYNYPRKSGTITYEIKVLFPRPHWHNYERNRWHTLSEMGGTINSEISKKIDGKRKQKALSLGTKIKREAQKLLIEYEEKFERGQIDPLQGWTPKKEAT